jgi:uncharacterized protein GlcG (DUF336 family)
MGSKQRLFFLAGASTAALIGVGHLCRAPVTAATNAPALTTADRDVIFSQGMVQASKEPSIFRPKPATTHMQIAVVDRTGALLGLSSMPDAWEGSKDIAIAKARTAAFFSSNDNALSSRTIGLLSQAHYPGPTDLAGPLWGIGNSNEPGSTGDASTRNGVITFPGGLPLYKNATLVGGVGVSGDGVDQDEAVAMKAATGFEAPAAIRVNTVVPSLPFTTATPHP